MMDIPDWKEGMEMADGIFRKKIPNYEDIVIRELIANALVHRPYTTRGDLFVNLYPDRLEIHNPGLTTRCYSTKHFTQKYSKKSSFSKSIL